MDRVARLHPGPGLTFAALPPTLWTAMPKSLVIVESPAKAKTISGLLGRDFVVEASIGHIRDLPNGADEVPETYKGEAWARLGVDVENGFKPLYVIPKQKKEQVRKLR